MHEASESVAMKYLSRVMVLSTAFLPQILQQMDIVYQVFLCCQFGLHLTGNESSIEKRHTRTTSYENITFGKCTFLVLFQTVAGGSGISIKLISERLLITSWQTWYILKGGQ